MINEIQGLHHVTALAKDPTRNNRFVTQILGLRRVKKTVNFETPDIYHLYYGDEDGSAGSLLTYFPYPYAAPRSRGSGEVGMTSFSVPIGSIEFWQEHLTNADAGALSSDVYFGQRRVRFEGPDGENLAVIESADQRNSWDKVISADNAIRGMHSVSINVQDISESQEILNLLGFTNNQDDDGVLRFSKQQEYPATIIDVQKVSTKAEALSGAGSVHHIAFAVANRAEQDTARRALLKAGYAVTHPKDRKYFWSIYFRSKDGILFEIPTQNPGFSVDEDPMHLGRDLMLPKDCEHLRPQLTKTLGPL